ncbi:MAG: metallopeptidase TldD-related protein [Candidatus Zixiibacteriota bacterium]
MTQGNQISTLSEYLDHFGITEKIIKDVMSAALSKGGNYCDLYFEHTINSSIGLEDNVINRASSNIDLGVGIRVLNGDQTGFSFSEEITSKAMILAAKTAANIANGPSSLIAPEFKTMKLPNYYPIELPWENIKIDQKIPLINQINEKVQSLDKRISKSRVYFSDSSSYILTASSDGKIAFDYRPMMYVSAGCTAEDNGQKESNGYDLSFRHGLEFLSPEKIEYLCKKSVNDTIRLFDGGKPPAGELEVILDAGSSGILLHEAIGHGMEADVNRKGRSVFADKIGKPVAENFISIIDDGSDPHFRGAINVDDECNDVQKTYLVKDGILTSYLHDRISAKYYDVEPTGSGRRESFRFSPLPRMRNTYMLNGPHTREEIIKSVKKGIICETFTNGQVDIGPGDFTFYVKLGYLVENGKITMPIKDFNIIGNGPDVLSKITMAADDIEFAEGGWTCGKGGQSVPVSMGLPSVKVSSITVGGVNS